MNVEDVVKSLHPLEQKALPHIKMSSNADDVSKDSDLKYVEVLRAFQWLNNKKLISVEEKECIEIKLGENGKKYADEELPEIRLLKSVKNKALTRTEAIRKSKLDNNEFGASMGLLRKKGFIHVEGKTISITDEGIKKVDGGFPEQEFLQELSKKAIKSVPKRFDSLLKRKDIIKVDKRKKFLATINDNGITVLKTLIKKGGTIDKLTTSMIRDGSWKNKIFRRYDLESSTPPLFGGKKQLYRSFLDWVRTRFVGMGFSEMKGPIIESEFWNSDALYIPQFHSARDIHDAYFVDTEIKAKLPRDVLDRVKRTHQDGGGSGSRGWRYVFDCERTKRLILRTQGTAESARMLANPHIKIPGKYFGITRAFRHDVIDATHLPDFNQTEGIVIDENLNFKHLIGLLKDFAREFAETDEIRIRPGYFPFTEPSCELFAKHPELGWVELGGAGMFRPEVVKTLLGREIPVLAWGLGIDRIAMFRLGLKDIRELFSHDLTTLRKGGII